MDGERQPKFRQSDQVVDRCIVDQRLLIPMHGRGADLQKVYLLNETSARIWDLLKQPLGLDELVGRLQAEYPDPEGQIRRDVEEFVRDLVQRGFVVQESAHE